MSKQKHGLDINLLQAPLRSSRPILQLSSGTYWVRGHGGKEKARHTVTVGNLNSCRAAAAQHGKFPDCMSNLSVILATACSALHAGETMFVMLQTVQLKICYRKGMPIYFEEAMTYLSYVCSKKTHFCLYKGCFQAIALSCCRAVKERLMCLLGLVNWFQIHRTHLWSCYSHLNPIAISYILV